MPCFNPIQGYRARHVNESGKRGIVFNAKDGFIDMPVKVPCGRCRGCRLEYSRQWAIRCVHEAQVHDDNSFITLTYNNDNLPENRSIDKRELQRFFKRLRKEIGEFRYFACGEYGEMQNRPHYHAIIFGYEFPDKLVWSESNGNVLYRSAQLEKVWNKGYCLIGDVTFESAAYVARYVMKKHKPDKRKTDEENKKPYQIVDRETGEYYEVQPEFCLMSKGTKKNQKGGIGKQWYDMYKGDTTKDFITINGKKVSVPRYYDRLLDKENPKELLRRKGNRIKNFDAENNTQERLIVREKCQIAKTQLLKRNFENEP